jgi:hypothetical protein
MTKATDVRNFYEARAKELIKDLRLERGMLYSDLAKKLKDYGATRTEQALINRINRSHKQFAFALMVLDALGAEFLEIPKPKELYPDGHKPGEALTKAGAARRIQKLLKK